MTQTDTEGSEGGLWKKLMPGHFRSPVADRLSDGDAATVAAARTVSLRDRGRRLNETGSTRPNKWTGAANRLSINLFDLNNLIYRFTLQF